MKILVLLAIGSVLVSSCLAFTCVQCRPERCPDPGTCRYGTTLDACECCSECYKGLGEKCGGAWNWYGKCAKHLKCVRPGPDLDDNYRTTVFPDFANAGICVSR